MDSKKNWKRAAWHAAFAIAAVAIAGGLSYLWNDAQSPWYLSLKKPAFTPPDLVFGIAWSVLYVLIAVDLFLLLEAGAGPRTVYPLVLTLMLGALWNFAFFGRQNAAAGVIVLAIETATCMYTILQSYRSKPLYGLLLLPWLLWQAFALVLNYAIYMVN